MAHQDAAIVAAARACLGVRFRLHGRSQAGLDCVGLAALAYGHDRIPAGYALRGGDPEQVARVIEGLGFTSASGGPCPADLLLLLVGPHQLHLAICSDRGFIHADARLRRVVEVPGPPPWPVIGRWRAV
jgi:hypothetical protein